MFGNLELKIEKMACPILCTFHAEFKYTFKNSYYCTTSIGLMDLKTLTFNFEFVFFIGPPQSWLRHLRALSNITYPLVYCQILIKEEEIQLFLWTNSIIHNIILVLE